MEWDNDKKADSAVLEFWCRKLHIIDIGDTKKISLELDSDPLGTGQDFGKVTTLVFTIDKKRYTFSRIRKEDLRE